MSEPDTGAERWQAVWEPQPWLNGGPVITKHPGTGAVNGYHASECAECNEWLADYLNSLTDRLREAEAELLRLRIAVTVAEATRDRLSGELIAAEEDAERLAGLIAALRSPKGTTEDEISEALAAHEARKEGTQ